MLATMAHDEHTPLALVLTEEESDDELQQHQIAVALDALGVHGN